MISPSNISMMCWNMIFSGSLIGLAQHYITSVETPIYPRNYQYDKLRTLSFLFVILTFIVMLPLYLVDKMQMDSLKQGNAQLAINSATKFPESVVRYSRIGEALLKSNLDQPALEVARRATKFNPHAPSGWGLILVNKSASFSERSAARIKLLELDPNNQEVRQYVIENLSVSK